MRLHLPDDAVSMATPTQLSLLAEDSETSPEGVPPLKPLLCGIKRVLMPNRNQLELRTIDLESLLPEGHRARLVWAYVMEADRDPIYAGILAVEGGSGRSAIARRFCSHCGCTRRSKGKAVPVPSPG